MQYYSGTYGSGVYTRTIPVTLPPTIGGWCFGSTGCACGTSAPSGPMAGGQPFRICGQNFLALASVQFGGPYGRVYASGCTWSSTAIACSATPPGAQAAVSPDGTVQLSVLNSDTRPGVAARGYSYLP